MASGIDELKAMREPLPRSGGEPSCWETTVRLGPADEGPGEAADDRASPAPLFLLPPEAQLKSFLTPFFSATAPPPPSPSFTEFVLASRFVFFSQRTLGIGSLDFPMSAVGLLFFNYSGIIRYVFSRLK
jgi:hypothetical protein